MHLSYPFDFPSPADVLSECCGASEQAKAAVLEADAFTELVRVGIDGGSSLQGSCVRCMSQVWDQCNNSIGQTLRRHKAVALLVAVGTPSLWHDAFTAGIT